MHTGNGPRHDGQLVRIPKLGRIPWCSEVSNARSSLRDPLG